MPTINRMQNVFFLCTVQFTRGLTSNTSTRVVVVEKSPSQVVINLIKLEVTQDEFEAIIYLMQL